MQKKSKKKLLVEKQNKLLPLTKEQLQTTIGGCENIPTVVDGNRGCEC